MMTCQKFLLVAAIALIGASPVSAQTAPKNNASQEVAADDPYLWLEDVDGDKALEWVRREDARTEAALTADPRYQTLLAEALDILEAEDRLPHPSFTSQGLLNFWQDANHPKGVLRLTTLESYRSENPRWKPVLDLDALNAREGRDWVYKGIVCLAPLQRRCMVALSDGGKDATVSREFDLESGKFVENGFTLPESLGSVEWVDENTLLVSRDFGEGTLTAARYPFTSRLWKRGEPLNQAKEVFRSEPTDVLANARDLRDASGTVQVELADRRVTILDIVHYVRKGGAWLQLDMPLRADLIGIVDGHILFSTDVEWKHGDQVFPADSVIAADLREWKTDPNGAAKTLVWKASDRQTRREAVVTAESLYVNLLDNVRGKVMKYDFIDGKWVGRAVDLPDNASIKITAASVRTGEIMFSVVDFLTPETLYYSDGGTPEVIKTSPASFNADGATVEQREALSRDGTHIPYFIVKPKGMKMDGSTPTLMTGYGGFQQQRLPAYLGTIGKLWLERGGAYVLANIRGGGEFGARWHDAAVGENKQRTWDDFIAVAEDLVARRYTSPRHLGITGASQGGLLVGVAITQRPDLFHAAISQVPLFDMLRFPYMGRGASWVDEYGDPRISEQRAWIERYSPYQKLVKGVELPQPFLITSTADDRTSPAHGRKAAARLAEIGQDYYYFEDMVGGHSAGVDPEQQAKLQALEYVYLLQRLKD